MADCVFCSENIFIRFELRQFFVAQFRKVSLRCFAIGLFVFDSVTIKTVDLLSQIPCSCLFFFVAQSSTVLNLAYLVVNLADFSRHSVVIG